MSKQLVLMTAAAALAFGGAAFAQTTASPPTADQPSTAASPADTMAPSTAAPAAAANVAVGQPVKDKTGATIGTVTDVKPDATGNQMATIKMGTDSFTVAAANLGVQNGVATVNASRSEILDMIKKSKS